MAVAAAMGFVGGNVGRWFSHASVAQADQPAQQIVAHSFVLADDAGNERGSLTLAKEGGVYLRLLDANHRPRTTLVVSPDGSHMGLFFFGPGGNVLASYPR